MKKITILLLILFLLMPTFGCGSKYRVSFLDAITKKPIKEINLNGRTFFKNPIELRSGTYEVKAKLYQSTKVEIKEDSEVLLNPEAYIVLDANAHIKSAKLDGKSVELTNILDNGSDLLAISPVAEGTHTLEVQNPFFLPITETISIHSGKNSVKLHLIADKEAISKYIDSLTFPLEKAGNIKIKISGVANKNPVSKTLSITKKDDGVLIVSDDYISYTYKNGTITLNNNAHLDEVDNVILSYAIDTIKSFLNLKDILKGMDLVKESGSEISFKKVGTFENRDISESITLKIEDNVVKEISIVIVQEDINTNLTIVVEVM